MINLVLTRNFHKVKLKLLSSLFTASKVDDQIYHNVLHQNSKSKETDIENEFVELVGETRTGNSKCWIYSTDTFLLPSTKVKTIEDEYFLEKQEQKESVQFKCISQNDSVVFKPSFLGEIIRIPTVPQTMYRLTKKENISKSKHRKSKINFPIRPESLCKKLKREIEKEKKRSRVKPKLKAANTLFFNKSIGKDPQNHRIYYLL